MNSSHRSPWRRSLLALLLFGTAFGYVEAAVVCYLRQLHEPARERFYAGRPPGELFPLLSLEQIQASGQSQTLAIEIGREAATILVLAAVGLAVAGNWARWAAAFVVAFGVWDIAFYAFLKLLLGWPSSLFTWDILFLIPVPWAAPVLAPVLVSLVMIAAGTWQLRREVRIWVAPLGGHSHGSGVDRAVFRDGLPQPHGRLHATSVPLGRIRAGVGHCRGELRRRGVA